jgi:hypothetical protein
MFLLITLKKFLMLRRGKEEVWLSRYPPVYIGSGRRRTGREAE